MIVLAVVINPEGFLKYSNIFEGNMADSKTLETIVNTLGKQTSFTGRKPIVVIDAGIATDENLKMLKSKQYHYMCVARSNLKQYRADTHSSPVEIKDQRNQPIELMKVKVGSDDDKYLMGQKQSQGLKREQYERLAFTAF
ncbi:MAG: transposase [Bacteroidales bacterium]|nr:transposase [Bacteroidales bacterium]